MKKLRFVFSIIAFSLIALLSSCEKNEPDEPDEPEIGDTLTGYTYYTNTTIPISEVLLSIDGKTSTSDSDGKYIIKGISNGEQTLTATKHGFDNYSVNLQITLGSNQHDVEMNSNSYAYNLKGTVTSENLLFGSEPLEFCKVVILNPDGSESNLKSQTSSTGFYQIPGVPQGSRTVRFSADDHETLEVNIFLVNHDYQLDVNISIDYESLIGTSYGGGILAYILKPEDPGFVNDEIHGLIAAPSNLDLAQWGCFETEIGNTGTAIGSGATNTISIVTGCNHETFAAQLCNDLVLNGYDDWFLPSIDELYKLYLNRNLIGGFGTSHYWSSSENCSGYAWVQSFFNGIQYNDYLKFYPLNVRAVRAF